MEPNRQVEAGPASASAIRIDVLGATELLVDGRRAGLGPQLAALLLVLLLEQGRTVPTQRVVQLLWGPEAGPGASATVRGHVRRLRSRIGPAGPRIVARSGRGIASGYRLCLAADRTDAAAFEQMRENGRRELAAGRTTRAAEALRAGLQLWRGPALADGADRPFARHEIERLTALHRAARFDLAGADLATGRTVEAIASLRGLADEIAGDERVSSALALALYRSGRVAEAADVCRTGLRSCVASGLDAPRLHRLQRAILCRAPELDEPLFVPAVPIG